MVNGPNNKYKIFQPCRTTQKGVAWLVAGPHPFFGIFVTATKLLPPVGTGHLLVINNTTTNETTNIHINGQIKGIIEIQ